jgi:hypothetical protein
MRSGVTNHTSPPPDCLHCTIPSAGTIWHRSSWKWRRDR